MSNDIGYGAAAIRSGEVKYQEKLVDLMKQAASKKPANDEPKAVESKPSNPNVGRNVDVKA